MSIRAQAKLLKIPRGVHYYKPKGMNAFNLYLTKLIDQQYLRAPSYGVPRMTDYLNGLGLRPVNHKRVERLYKIMDIKVLGPNPNTSRSDPRTYKYPYLLRNLNISHPNQVWVADVTYTALPSGYMYLFSIMDLYSRFIIAWDISNSMTVALCKYVLGEALLFFPIPEILNTDQGIQFISELWTKELLENDIEISMMEREEPSIIYLSNDSGAATSMNIYT